MLTLENVMTMLKKSVLLSLGLLLLPSCGGTKPRYSTSITSQHSAPVERARYDEELGAFVVANDDNKFSAAVAAKAHQDEELTVATPMVGDTHSDSTQYGLKPIYFEYNQYRVQHLQPDQKPVFEHNVHVLKKLTDKGYRISVEGHACDSDGSTEYNMMLSEDRAREVKQTLEKKGVRGEILYVGYGSEHLIVPTGDRRQQAPNRRVEIYAYLPDEALPS